MAAASAGKQVRPKKLVKGGTASTRRHRFESFNQRIAKLNIDPVRRRRRNEADEIEVDTLGSFFRTSHDRWKDLNLSECFTSFTNEVNPISQSLPQVLHNNQRIFDILVRYIERRDTLALEPLLDLLASLAHDLGVKFEEHFLKATTLVASLAATHKDVEAIEWSFTCLAWLFKYLSRLLVPNLGPVFTIMAPLLGREPQKPHTMRFAAEAMSFLVRKAATVYAKNPGPLSIIISAIRDDLLTLKRLDSTAIRLETYQRGLMTLLVNSIKGIERKLHSSGVSIYQCMSGQLLMERSSHDAALEEIVFGVTVALVHHCDAETFSPILAMILERIEMLEERVNSVDIGQCGHLLFVVSTVRKGTRIGNWTMILDSLLILLGGLNQSTHEAILEVYKAAAVVLQLSPLDLLLPKFRIAMDTIASDHLASYFLTFSTYFYDLGAQRFQDLVWPYASKLVASHWQNYEAELCVALPKLGDGSTSNKIVCPAAWQDRIVSKFQKAIICEESIDQCNGYIALMDCMLLTTATNDHIATSLGIMVDNELSVSSGPSRKGLFALGNGLKLLCHGFSQKTPRDRWPALCTKASLYGSFPLYLEAILGIPNAGKVQEGNVDILTNALIENTHSSSHQLRKLSIQIIDALYTMENGEEAEILSTMLSIENSPLDLQSARSVSMQIRKLGSQYERASFHPWLQIIVPHFCFGMLTFKLSQIWDDATTVLEKICEVKVGEEIVSSLAFRWLEGHGTNKVQTDPSSSVRTQQQLSTEFECTNLSEVEGIFERDSEDLKAASEHLKRKFEASHALLGGEVDDSANHALRVLSAVPHVAEKRSRQLIPKFLSWATHETEDVRSPVEETKAHLSLQDPPQQRLRRKDQKAILDLFASFKNPRVLYRCSEVFTALQELLTNGNVEIQKAALQALFTWKLQGIQPYQENLLNLLDEARFRDEIATFLQVDKQNSIIQEEHRPELMPIMLRLLYGKMIAGTGSGSRTQAVRRKAVLQALSRSEDKYLGDFVSITLGRLRDIKLFIENHTLDENVLEQQFMGARKQVGLVNMMKDMLDVLGARLSPFAQDIITALLYCLIRAIRPTFHKENDTEQVIAKDVSDSLLKAVRHTGLQCINLLFHHCPASLLEQYVSAVFEQVLSPRLQKLPIETAQSVSGTLQLFATWASSQESVLFLTGQDTRTVDLIIDCLGIPSAKDEVKLFVLNDILKPVVELSKVPDRQSSAPSQDPQPEIIFRRVLQPSMEYFLGVAGTILRQSPSKDLLTSTIKLISMLASLVEGSSQISNLLDICTFLLDQPSNRVNPRSKGELLQVIQHFVPLVESQISSELQDHIFLTVSSLFGYFKDRENRVILSRVLIVLAKKDVELEDVAQLCTSLNAFSAKKIDEPDFDERLNAFSAINETKYKDFSSRQWRPILYNMLFYVRDGEETAIRSNASYAIRQCIKMNAVNTSHSESDSSNLCKTVLMPALLTGVSEASEVVRSEYLAIMAELVRTNQSWEVVNDMSVLLVGDDDEASFFGNVLHIQQHRRLRALRRLASEAGRGTLRSANVAHFFLPLIEHFVFDKADDDTAHNLSAETVFTIGALASSLEWPQFRAVFRRYSSYVQAKPQLEKTVIKLLGVIIDALSQAADEKENIHDQHAAEVEHPEVLSNAKRNLAITMPRKERLADDLIQNLLPALEKYLHDKDESTVSLRVPVAVSVVKLLKLLPSDRLRDRLPPVLTDVCHILRSRSQDSRDLTRKTLVEISTLIGPAYFGFVLNELRSSLARGYQLHVLSYTVHSILVATSPIFRPGDLDYCLPQVVAVVMDDIFGVIGQEKDAEDYISKMREVKSSKSYDSLELVAKTATVGCFAQLIKPLQLLLEEKVDLRMVKKIDEFLRRIGVGLLRNDAVQDQRTLVFCYEIIQEVYQKRETSHRTSKDEYRTKRFLVNHKGASKSGERGSTTTYNYKLARFALDLLRSVLQKHENFQTPSNLLGFIPIIGDAVVQSNEEIQISALRLLTSIIKVPLKAIDDNAPIYIAECVKIVKASTSTNVELAQAALKLVSAILRERRTVDIRENDLAFLLKRLIPDLEEPDRQGVAFNFLKAIMSRKIVITEVYGILDTVAGIMVTNQTKGARDMARGAYFHFIMEYPQSKDRFTKQLDFLVRNLDYKHEEGRQSVMEAVHLLFTKVGEDQVQDIASTFFVPLVMLIVNDESGRCREMAGALLKKVFERADAERTQSFLGLLRIWLENTEEPLLNRVALQMYGLYLDTNGAAAKKEMPTLQSRVSQVFKKNLKSAAEADWELLYFVLGTFTKICHMFPVAAFATNSAALWSSVRRCLSFPHAWVKLSSAQLLGTYFADFARTNADNNDMSLPLKGSGGLWLTELEIIEVTRASLGLLRIPRVSEELANQSVRNLVFLGKVMAQTSMTWPQKDQNLAATDLISAENLAPSEDEEQSDEGIQNSDTFEGFDQPPPAKPAIGHLITQTSRLLRRGPLTTRTPSLTPLHSSLRLLGALTTTLPTATLLPHLPILLLPLHNLTDPSIPHPTSTTDTTFTENYKALVANAQELMGSLQEKFGTTLFLGEMNKVRQGVKGRREERRVKRRIESVREPERREAIKRRKGERKKVRRREKGEGMRGLRRGW